jgi:methylated-DNA-[protein]-cysteine S-methyltransferase
MTPEAMPFRLDRLDTPVGEMLIVQDDRERLRALDWKDYADRMAGLFDRYYGKGKVELTDGDGSGRVVEALRHYIAGDVHAIDDLEVEAQGTAFQQRVWRELRRIPCGETRSYGELARRIGKPRASRAVGLANGANPIGIVVPCHRVIGADRSLTGYGGGLERKRWLLEHEGVKVGGPQQLTLV